MRRRIFIADTSKTDGSGLTGLVYNSSGLVAWYFPGDGAAAIQITLASATLGTWTSGGFVEVANMPGWYELGIPNAALDGGNEVAIQLRGATNMAVVNVYIELDTVDYQTDAFGALKPTTAGRTLDVTATGAAGIDWGNVENPTTTVALTNTTINAAPIADAVWDEAYSQHTTAGTFGKLMDILRKSNTVLEGTILASPTPTTTVFRLSGIDYPTGALEHAILWMASGTSQNQNSPILTTVNNGDGTVTVTLEEALVTAPVAGDTVLIDPTSHVHTVSEMQGTMPDRLGYLLAILAGAISDAGTAAETYTITLGASTFTVDYSGLDATGNRTGATLTKT
jgi:hypothetical protein